MGMCVWNVDQKRGAHITANSHDGWSEMARLRRNNNKVIEDEANNIEVVGYTVIDDRYIYRCSYLIGIERA